MRPSRAWGVLILAAGRQGGSTPLHEAVYGGEVEVVKALIAKGADVNAKDKVCEELARDLAHGLTRKRSGRQRPSLPACLPTSSPPTHTPPHPI